MYPWGSGLLVVFTNVINLHASRLSLEHFISIRTLRLGIFSWKENVKLCKGLNIKFPLRNKTSFVITNELMSVLPVKLYELETIDIH